MAEHEPEYASALSSGDQLRFRDGHEVDAVARGLWPGGVVVDVPAPRHDEAVTKTNALLADTSIPAVFQAAFTALGVQIRVDVLERSDDGLGFHLFEVKSSNSPKPEHIPDIAIQAAVLEAASINIISTNLVHLDRNYTRDPAGIDPSQLMVVVDMTSEVRAEIDEIRARVPEYLAVLNSGDRPEVATGSHCHKPYDCRFWDFCTSDRPEHHISTLPYLRGQRLQVLESMGVDNILDIPAEYKLTERQELIRQSVVSDSVWRSDDLEFFLEELQPPVHYVDFETIHPAVPRFAGTRPHMQVPFQWSCLTDKGTCVPSRSDFLAEGDGDPRREFVESLLEAVGEEGPIVVYANFEELRLAELKEIFPDLELQIDEIIGRLWDLEKVVNKNFYHPQFRGKTSIKNVLPALVPGEHYEALEIRDGDAASLEFTKLLDGEYTPDQATQKRADLLSYCGLDALAMKLVVDSL